jgi:hypothetical protein
MSTTILRSQHALNQYKDEYGNFFLAKAQTAISAEA